MKNKPKNDEDREGIRRKELSGLMPGSSRPRGLLQAGAKSGGSRKESGPMGQEAQLTRRKILEYGKGTYKEGR